MELDLKMQISVFDGTEKIKINKPIRLIELFAGYGSQHLALKYLGVRDEDFSRVAENQSNASLYHLAGDSIVVDVLMAIFKEMM